MKIFIHLALACAFLFNGFALKAQAPEIRVIQEEGGEIIKILNDHHCPYDISDNKKHVVIQAYAEASSYYWSEETGVIAFDGSGFAVSDDGVVAGFFSNEDGYNVAGLWYPTTQKWEFLGMNPDIPEFADIDYNSAWTMSNDGEKVGVMQFDEAWNTYTYVWSKEDGYVKLSNGQSTNTRPQGMSSDGRIIAGFFVDDMGYRAPCYWSNWGTGNKLFTITSSLGESWGVSPNGEYVCGGLKNSKGNAFIYHTIKHELTLIENTLSEGGGDMTALCVTDDGNAFGYLCTGDPADYKLRRGFAYVDGELMFFEDFLMTNGILDADSWSVYSVNSVTADGKTFIGAAKMKGKDYTFAVTIPEAECDAPDNLTYTIDENFHNSITLSWDAPENPVDVTYEIYTSYTEIDPIYQGITETSFTIDNMDAGYYKFLVKANWGGECLSNASNSVSPVIYPCAQNGMCEITFEMLDGYGDGWNGAYIDIIPKNSDFTYSVGLEKEGLETITKNISLCPDDYTFVWHRGEFDEEISFSILFDGAEIYRADTGDIDYMFPVSFFEYKINCAADIEEAEQTSPLNLYPNPVNDKLYIVTEAEIEEVVVYDVFGRLQDHKTTRLQDNTTIDVSGLNNGVYFVKIYTDNVNFVKRIIKQ